jgi:hypothetical protein
MRIFFRILSILFFAAGFLSLMLAIMVWDHALGGWLTGKGMYMVQSLGFFFLAVIMFFISGLCHRKVKRLMQPFF